VTAPTDQCPGPTLSVRCPRAALYAVPCPIHVFSRLPVAALSVAELCRGLPSGSARPGDGRVSRAVVTVNCARALVTSHNSVLSAGAAARSAEFPGSRPARASVSREPGNRGAWPEPR
jgi:hypothetical protein